MKVFFSFLFFFNLMFSTVHAQEDAWSYTSDDLRPGEVIQGSPQELQEALDPVTEIEEEDEDPWEPFNRVVFGFNEILDSILFDRIAAMYKGVVPEFIRERVGYALRNLSEPIVFANNILQGNLEGAADTFGRFTTNSILGIGGLFDVSTDWGIPYKKQDFGLTLASWGADPGPYLVLPILGPSNVRDTFGRIGDYAFDPINWWAYFDDKAVYSNARTGIQIIDAKTDNIEIIEDLRNNSVDTYAAFRAWYTARRKALIGGEQAALDTPRPDDED